MESGVESGVESVNRDLERPLIVRSNFKGKSQGLMTTILDFFFVEMTEPFMVQSIGINA